MTRAFNSATKATKATKAAEDAAMDAAAAAISIRTKSLELLEHQKCIDRLGAALIEQRDEPATGDPNYRWIARFVSALLYYRVHQEFEAVSNEKDMLIDVFSALLVSAVWMQDHVEILWQVYEDLKNDETIL